jgi:membrane associated rhomboid family serine protease
MFNAPLLVVALVGLLLVIHGAIAFMGKDVEIWSIYAFSFIPQRLLQDALATPVGAQVWSFLTYALLHGSWTHVISNSLWLLVFATPVVRFLGNGKSLVLLAVSAIAGAAAMLVLYWGQFIILVGASAAVSGAMGAAMPIMYAPGFRAAGAGHSGPMQALSFGELLRNRNAVVFTVVFFALQLLTGASEATTGTAFLSESVIAWEAHLGGFLAGLAMFYLLASKGPSQPQRM